MRTFYLIAATLSLVACNHANDVQCQQASNCDLSSGGECFAASTGNMWCAYPDPACPSGYRFSNQNVGDGVGGVCVPDNGMPDAGIDAPMHSPDAPHPDAALGDIIANGQAADFVIGQQEFTTADINHGGISASSLRYPSGLALSDAGGVWILDSGNARGLGFSSDPVTDFPAAGVVVGQTNFTNASAGDSASMFSSDTGQLGAAAGYLLIPNQNLNRVMIFAPQPTTNGASATVILGQANATSTTSGDAATNLDLPSGVWTDGTRVAVADTANSRVLIWNSFPTTNAQAADIVLGQTTFGMTGFPATPTLSSMHFPREVFSDGTRLFVTDTQNNRILIWNTFPTTSGQAADVVVGQADGTTSGAGVGPAELAGPLGVAVAGGSLFVADGTNNRVVVYSPIPTASGVAANLVLGQTTLTTATSGCTQNDFDAPSHLVVHGHKLYVADTDNQRVLVFGLVF